MTHRRKAKEALKQQLPAPRPSQGWFVRTLLWVFRSDVSAVFTMGVLFALGVGVGHLLPSRAADLQTFVAGAFSLLIFGVFLGVILVTEEDSTYTHTGWRIRVVCGAIGGAAIAVLVSTPLEGVFLGAAVGAALLQKS